MLREESKESSLANTKRGCTGFDVVTELEAACRVTLSHVKIGDFKTNANENNLVAA